MNLLYISNLLQLEDSLRRGICSSGLYLIVTGDMATASRLHSLGIPFVEEFDQIDAKDIETNWHLANELAERWWENGWDSIKLFNISLTHSARQEFVYPFEAVLNAKKIYEKIIKNYKINKIFGYFLPPVGVARTGPAPTFHPVMSVVQATIFWIADKENIKIHKLFTKNQSPISGINQIYLGKIDSSISGDVTNKNIIVMRESLPSSEYEEIIDQLNKSQTWAPISITNNDLSLQELFDNSNIVLQNKTNNVTNLFNQNRHHSKLYPEIFNNPYLGFQFERIFNEIMKAAAQGIVFSGILDAVKPAAIIWGHEAFTIERVQVQIAKQRNISTIAMLHGGISPIRGFCGVVGDADHIMIWNDFDYKLLTYYGVDPSRIIKSGSLRYAEKYIDYINNDINMNNKNKLKKHLNIPTEKPVIVVLTAATNTSLSAIIANQGAHRKTLIDIARMAEARPDLVFVIKTHPNFDHYDYYKEYMNISPLNVILLKDINLDDALSISDLGVMINYCTTAGLEAILQKIPTIFINTAVYPIYELRHNFPENGIIELTSINDFETIVDEMFANDAYKTNTINRQTVALEKILGELTLHSKDNIIKMFEDIINNNANPYQNPDKLHKVSKNKFKEFDAPELSESDVFQHSYLIGNTAKRPADIKAMLCEIMRDIKLSPISYKYTGMYGHMIAIRKHIDRKKYIMALRFMISFIIDYPRQLFLLSRFGKKQFIKFTINIVSKRNLIINKSIHRAMPGKADFVLWEK